jgi:hypothetical protein
MTMSSFMGELLLPTGGMGPAVTDETLMKRATALWFLIADISGAIKTPPRRSARRPR